MSEPLPQVLDFISEFSSITNTSYNKIKSDKTSVKSLLTGFRKCIFNVRKHYDQENQPLNKDKTKGKNTECCSKLQFKLKRPVEHVHDSSCDQFNFELDINYQHNHAILAASALKFHPVSENTKNKFLSYFQDGHSASSAYHKHKVFLQAYIFYIRRNQLKSKEINRGAEFKKFIT